MLDNSALLRALASTPKTISATVTRPADTTAYAGGDTIANATSGAALLTFTGVARKTGGSFLLNRLVVHDNFSPTVVNLDMALYLLSATITAPNDNAAIALVNADNLKIIACIFIPGQTTVFSLDVVNGGTPGGEGIVFVDNLNLLLNCAAADANLYGVVEVLNPGGYTPAASESWRFDLVGEQL